MLSVRNFQIEIDDKDIITDVSLTIKKSELHVMMGPNGSGKSSISLALSGHPTYHIHQKSKASLDGVDLLALLPQERVQHGLFLSFQQPIAIPGLSVQQLIKATNDHVMPEKKVSIATLRQKMDTFCQLLEINREFLTRSVNDGFSGGEKKRLEMLQLLMIQPKVAILDEIDSGLDVDAIKIIANAINYAQKEFKTAFLVVTHYRRILDHVTPDQVHIMVKGRLVKSGGNEIIDDVEKNGYKNY